MSFFSFQLADQQEAEKKKQQSETIQAELSVQLTAVAENQEKTRKDLERVEPAVIEAQNGLFLRICVKMRLRMSE